MAILCYFFLAMSYRLKLCQSLSFNLSKKVLEEVSFFLTSVSERIIQSFLEFIFCVFFSSFLLPKVLLCSFVSFSLLFYRLPNCLAKKKIYEHLSWYLSLWSNEGWNVGGTGHSIIHLLTTSSNNNSIWTP